MLTRRDMLRLAGASLAASTPAMAHARMRGIDDEPRAAHTAHARDAQPRDATHESWAAQDASRDARRLPLVGATPAGYACRGRLPNFDIIQHTHALGLGSVQTRLASASLDEARALRTRLDTLEMRAVLGVTLPRDRADVDRFDAAVRAAKEAGAVCLHAATTGRRYEEFDSLQAFQAAFAKQRDAVTLAEPILRRHRLAIAIENHKGWRAAEQAAWFNAVGSEYVGVCFDFGNNLSLCEDPLDSVQLLAPLTRYCHLKDMAVDVYGEGFLLSEVPLGEGILDLPRMIAAVRARDPQVILGLEMITRDPLRIPVLADSYWVTFADASSPLPGHDLARTIRLVRQHPPARPLPRVTGLGVEAQVSLEDECIARSLRCARGPLSL